MHPNTMKIIGLLSKYIPKLPYPVFSGHLKGIKFIFGSAAGECGGASIYLNKAEPEQIEALANNLKSGNIFFDVGANIGLYSMLGSRIVGQQGKVISIEPDLRNLSFLYRHAKLNRARNITLIAAACSNSAELHFFSQGPNCATGHLDQSGKTDSTPVLSTTLDELTSRMNIFPDVMKIDVEGAEMDVLTGAAELLKKHKPILFLSTHSKALRTDCLDYLKKLDYHISSLTGDIEKSSEFIAV